MDDTSTWKADYSVGKDKSAKYPRIELRELTDDVVAEWRGLTSTGVENALHQAATDFTVLVNGTPVSFKKSGNYSVTMDPRTPLTFTDLERALKRITYKKDWEISLHNRNLTGGMTLRITVFNVPDTYTGISAELNATEIIHAPLYRLDDFYEHVWRLIHKTEMHEAQEWFKVDGKLPHDPHRGDGGHAGQYTEKMLDPHECTEPEKIKTNTTDFTKIDEFMFSTMNDVRYDKPSVFGQSVPTALAGMTKGSMTIKGFHPDKKSENNT